ncbi:uncharacterized protein LOC122508309 [Leptopilina heterotoma]|uniref:uncharacterized protein LOC122508309 n=1 Tax=Leptopilina heterotoma TaxID=63436 RepID=UPI001CA8D29B|nr:uncharacterized protein LOC122508309 [Leptopilina heterotoma]XP_043477527.1 uncharacterized protein LOC122508309 [Leptopilina heterotoma]
MLQFLINTIQLKMKFNKEVLYFLLVLIQINNFCLSEEHDYHDMHPKNELSNLQKSNISFCEFVNSYDKLSLIDKAFGNYYMHNLLIIIAYDMSDGIMLANFLSDERIEVDIEPLSDAEFIVKNEIWENFYFYYSWIRDTYIFVYPRNTSNTLLATYLTNKIINKAENFKVALTCENYNDDTWNSIFKIASNILDVDIQRDFSQLIHSIFFLPSYMDNNEECRGAFEELLAYINEKFNKFSYRFLDEALNDKNNLQRFTKKQQLEILVSKSILGNANQVYKSCSNSLLILKDNYLPKRLKLIKFFNFLTPETNIINNKCFEKIQTTDISFMTDLYFLPHRLILSSKDASKIKFSNEELISVIIDNFCKHEMNIKIFKLMCFIRNIIDNELISNNYFQQIIYHYLEHQKKWLSNLNVCFENDTNTKETQISNETDNIIQYKFPNQLVREVETSLFPTSTKSEEYNCIFSTFFESLKTLNEVLVNQKYEKLFLVIVDDMKDGIELANFISNESRVDLAEKIRYTNPILFTMIIENHYLYYSRKINTYILVYPRNVQNHLLATYLTKMTITSSKNLKIALTCKKEINKFTLNSMFLIASEILELDMERYFDLLQNKIIILPSNIKEDDSSYQTMKDQLKKYLIAKFTRYLDTTDLDTWFRNQSNFKSLHFKDQLEYLALIFVQKNYFFNKKVQGQPLRKAGNFLVQDFLPTNLNIISIRYFSVFNYNPTDTCTKKMFLNYNKNHKETTDITSLRGLLSFPNWITQSKQEMYINKNRNDKLIKKFIVDLCSSRSGKIKIVQMICIVRYVDGRRPNQEFKLLSLLQYFIVNYYYADEKAWFFKLESIFQNRISENRTQLLMKAQELYEEIFKIDEKKQKLMIEAFYIVNNSLKSQINHSCSLLNNNGNYNLKLKGDVINFSQTLYTDYCPGKVSVLEMFATDKIVIDEDLISNELEQLNIIAPIWEIISSRIIRLDGAPGQNIWDPETFSDGIYGLHGSSGRPGGTFFGIVDNIINKENLQIVSNGGNGSDGQDGYDLVWTFENISWCDIFRENFEGKGGNGGVPGFAKIYLLNNFTNLNIKLSFAEGKNGRSGKVMRLEVDYAYIQNMIVEKKSFCQIAGRRIKNELSISSSNLDTNIQEDNFILSISDYKRFILHKAFTTDRMEYVNLYKKFNDQKFVDILPINYFAYELLDLEYYYSLEAKTSVFNSIYTEMRLVLLKEDKNLSNDYKIFSSKLNELILKRLFQSEYNETINEIHYSLDQCIEKFKNTRITKIEETGKLFLKNLENIIQENEKFINNQKLKVENEIVDLNKDITKQLEELDVKKDNKINEFKKRLSSLHLLTFCKFILFSLSVLNPILAVIDNEIKPNSPDNISSTNKEKYYEMKLPFTITDLVETTLKKYNDEIIENLKFTETKLNIMKEENNEINSSDKKLKTVANLYQDAYQKCILISNQAFRIKECMITEIRKREIRCEKKNKKYNNYQKSLDITRRTRQALEFSNNGIMSYGKISKHQFLLNTIEETFQVEESNAFTTEYYKNGMHNIISQLTDNFRSKLIISGFAISLTTLLEHKKEQMDKFLNDVKSQVKSALENQTNSEIKNTIEIVKKAIDMILHMQNLIKENNLKQRNVDYVKNMESTLVQNMTIKDEDVFRVLRDIEQVEYSNDIKDYCKTFVLALKGYAYPFLGNFSQFFSDLPKLLNNGSVDVDTSIGKLRSLETLLRKENGLLETASHSYFGNKGLKPAFFTWNNASYSEKIKDLLKGRRITLFANISQAQNSNAIKFRNIDISFTSDDSEMNYELNNVLKYFNILFIHHGDSYYRCMNKVHLIKTDTMGIFYKQKGLNFNDYILSPFATWTIQLYGINSEISFGLLAKFVDHIDLELVGDGQYILNNKSICNDESLNKLQII